MIVVQPLLATAVVWALPLGAKLSGQKVVRRDIFAAIAVCAGLGVFLVISDPTAGRDDAPIAAWLVAGGALCAVAAVLALYGLSGTGAQGAWCGAAAGSFSASPPCSPSRSSTASTRATSTCSSTGTSTR